MKLKAFFKRGPGMAVEEFRRHWRTRNAEFVVRQAGLRRYVQNPMLASCYRSREPDFDGVAEAWFDGVGAMRALSESREYRAVRDDEANFIDPASMKVVLTDEVVILDGAAPPEGIKPIGCLRWRADRSPGEPQKDLREVHGPLAAALPG